MIQIVEKIYIKIADVPSPEWSELPIVPATAKIETEISKEEAGWLRTTEFKATLSRKHPWLFRNLIVNVLLDDGKTLSIGSSDIPVHFTLERSNAREVSFKHKTRADM